MFKMEIKGSPDVMITEAFDPFTLKTHLDNARIRIRDGEISIEVLNIKDDCWRRYKIEDGEIIFMGVVKINEGF